MKRKLHKQSGMFPDPAHLFPDGDRFEHRKSVHCKCNPVYESRYVPGIGGALWFEHNLVDPEYVDVPDTLPKEWQ